MPLRVAGSRVMTFVWMFRQRFLIASGVTCEDVRYLLIRIVHEAHSSKRCSEWVNPNTGSGEVITDAMSDPIIPPPSDLDV